MGLITAGLKPRPSGPALPALAFRLRPSSPGLPAPPFHPSLPPRASTLPVSPCIRAATLIETWLHAPGRARILGPPEPKETSRVRLRDWRNTVAATRKNSARVSARKFADIAEHAFARLPAAEQERRIVALERAAAKLSRNGNSKASRKRQTASIPLHTRARE